MTDTELVALYWDRDQGAIAQSQVQYGSYCYCIAHSILNSREDAEECVNDTWLKAWNAIPPHKPSKLSLFLGKITRNLAFNKYKLDRAKKRGGELPLILGELDDCVPTQDSVEQAISDSELQRLMNDFLRGLPERERKIFLLRYWQNAPLREIGAALSMSENNVKASLFRSRKKLKARFEQEEVFL